MLERFPSAEVWNTYGPTEATVATTSVRITADMVTKGGPLPIGLPRPGSDVYLLDENGQRPPPGDGGEIMIAGPNVSPGYLGAPAMTARAFFGSPQGRTYRTGDRGIIRDGMLYFEGRQDSQIKLHGYRIELADIEANLRALPAVSDCAVVPVVRDGAAQFLVAFVVPSDEMGTDSAPNSLATDKLRAALAERLPAYMVPRKIHLLDALPITPNGKADRRKLSDLAVTPKRPPAS